VTARPKQALRDELLAALAASLATARAAHAAAVEGATHSEARAENAKDTRGLEQSYLARGQAQRVEELAAALAAVEAMVWRRFGGDDPIDLGALVTADEDGAEQRFLIAPQGGGIALSGGVQVVTPRSPLGRALVGAHAGDDVVVQGPGTNRELGIVAVE
jgi:transcription elongation GreA/GreB family factor